MDSKLKYIKYKQKYLDLQKKKIIYNLIGGNCDKDIKLIHTDIDSTLNFIKNHYECSPLQTVNNYFVILYGPPASGKTIARKLACKIIKDNFSEEQLSYDEIMKSFIDTSVDDIIAKTIISTKLGDETYNKTVEEVMIENIDKIISRENKNIDYFRKNINDQSIQELIKNNSSLYDQYRKYIDELSLVLGAFATYINRNVFFEISSPYIDYVIDLINTVYKWKYKIIFIYPYTDNFDELCKRSDLRGLQIGRFIDCDNINKKIHECYKKYMSDVFNYDNPNSMLNLYENIIILRYNTLLNEEEYKSISNNTFEINDVNPKIYDFIIKK